MSIAAQMPLNDVIQTVSRPVVIDVMRELRELMRISSKTEIRYYGDDGGAYQAGSTLNVQKESESENRWPLVENLTIEVNETPDLDQIHTVQGTRYDAQPIFVDQALGIYMWPVYSTKRVEVVIQYKAQDRNQAERWANEMRTRYAQGRDVLWHSVNYSYNLPAQYLHALEAIHGLREKVAPYGDSFEQWLRKCLIERATIVTNMAGAQKELAIAEKQVRVQGMFESVHSPDKPTKDSEDSRWISTITYVFSYQQPIELMLQYPLVVHQQLVPKAYRPKQPLNSFQDAFKTYQRSTGSLEPFSGRNQALMTSGNAGLVLPVYDQFQPRSIQTGTVRALSAIAAISTDDRRSLIDLSTLGDFSFHTDVLEFMRAVEWQFMALPYASIMQVTHYKDTRIQSQDDIEVNSALLVKLKQDGDLRKTYRVRVGLVVDFDLLPKAALDRLKLYPKAAIRLIKAINAAIRSMGNYRDIGKTRMTPEDLFRIDLGYDDNWNVVPIADATKEHKGDDVVELALVETLYLVTFHK